MVVLNTIPKLRLSSLGYITMASGYVHLSKPFVLKQLPGLLSLLSNTTIAVICSKGVVFCCNNMVQDFQGCPGNFLFCTGMIKFNCCNNMETLENKGKFLLKHKRNNDQNNYFVEGAPK